MLKKIWHVFLACFLIFVSVSGVLAFPLSVSAATSSTINICMVNYTSHNDTSGNSVETYIQASLPNILIDNTAHSLWGINGSNGGNNDCIPSLYTPLGIQVFGYIDDGFNSNTGETLLSTNETRIAGIAADGATGVFMDEVNASPTGSPSSVGTDQYYLTQIYNTCVNYGLKLIINTGVNSFSYAFLKTVSNYIMTNEAYTSGSATGSETGYGLSNVMVTNDNVATEGTALTYGKNAWTAGYHWVWMTPYTDFGSSEGTCSSYLAAWVSDMSSYSAAATLGSLSISSLANTSVTLNGSVSSVGGSNPTVKICYGTVNGGITLSAPSGYSGWSIILAPTSPSQPQTAASFYLNVTGLSPSTTYYYNATAVNTGGQSWV